MNPPPSSTTSVRSTMVVRKALWRTRDAWDVGVRTGAEVIGANGGYDAGGWGDYANAVAGKIGAVLFAGCVAGVEGEGKDVETECCAKGLMMMPSGRVTRWR